jgi:hypothetical protein
MATVITGGGAAKPTARAILYIDIDGVMLLRLPGRRGLRDGCEVAPHALDFLIWAVQHFDCFWLSSWSRYGEIEEVQRAFRLAGGHEFAAVARPIIASIRAVRWKSYKTDGIDFSRDFVWLDDAPLAAEIAELVRRGRFSSLVRVSTDVEPESLLRVRAQIAAASIVTRPVE